MTDCPFQLVNSKWTCPDCGWVYPLEADEPPCRNCPKSPQGIAGRIANLAHAAREQYSNTFYMRDPEQLTRLIGICLDCEHFVDRCNDGRFPSGCDGCRHWLKSLSSVGFRECPMWQDGQAG